MYATQSVVRCTARSWCNHAEEYIISKNKGRTPFWEIAMTITPIEDLFTHQLHQAYNRSMRAGVSSWILLRVVPYLVEVLKRFIPRMKLCFKM